MAKKKRNIYDLGKYVGNYYEIYGYNIEDGILVITHIEVQGKGFGKDLEGIVKSSGQQALKPANVYERAYSNNQSIEEALEETNSSRTVMVDNLGPGILGMYDPSTDTVYVLNNLDAKTTEWVKEHEYAHRYMAYMGIPQSEKKADEIATAKTGNDLFPYRRAA